jgi:hypothetical protein
MYKKGFISPEFNSEIGRARNRNNICENYEKNFEGNIYTLFHKLGTVGYSNFKNELSLGAVRSRPCTPFFFDYHERN